MANGATLFDRILEIVTHAHQDCDAAKALDPDAANRCARAITEALLAENPELLLDFFSESDRLRKVRALELARRGEGEDTP